MVLFKFVFADNFFTKEQIKLKKGPLIYEGKAKKIYQTEENPDYCIMEFKDDLTAFDGEKKDTRHSKGMLNNLISSLLFKLLQECHIPTHFIKKLSEVDMLVWKTSIIQVEVVVRNIVAGSLAKRTGLQTGTVLSEPIIEFYYKSDELHDPMLNDYHIKTLDLASHGELYTMTEHALKINNVLSSFLSEVDLEIVDFKLEFGKRDGQILLSDEITPDTCRLWDKNTKQSLDKDVFRQGSGDVLIGYREVYSRIKGCDYNEQ